MGLWHLTCRWTCSNFQTKCEIAPFDLQMKGRSMKLMGCVQSAAAGSPVRKSLIACRVNQSKWRRAQTARSCCLVIDVASPDKGNSRKSETQRRWRCQCCGALLFGHKEHKWPIQVECCAKKNAKWAGSQSTFILFNEVEIWVNDDHVHLFIHLTVGSLQQLRVGTFNFYSNCYTLMTLDLKPIQISQFCNCVHNSNEFSWKFQVNKSDPPVLINLSFRNCKVETFVMSTIRPTISTDNLFPPNFCLWAAIFADNHAQTGWVVLVRKLRGKNCTKFPRVVLHLFRLTFLEFD